MGCSIHVVAETRDGGKWNLSDVEVPNGRNYFTFGILANVRNGFVSAGCDLGDPLPFISEPRGYPEDMSKELVAKLGSDDEDGFWLGDHSFSWVTLEEMLNYAYDEEIVTRGMVSSEQAAKFRETGEKPKEWYDWTNKEGYEHLEWKRPMKEAAWLFGEIVEKLIPLGKPENVRIVFGFDS